MPTFLSVGSAWFFEIQQAALLIYVGFRCTHYRHSSIRLWRAESENRRRIRLFLTDQKKSWKKSIARFSISKEKDKKGERSRKALRIYKSFCSFLHIYYFDVCPSWLALFGTFQTFHGTFVISVAVAEVYFALVCDALHLCNRVMLVYTQKIEFLSTLQYSVCVCCSRLKKNWEPLCLLALVVVSAFITAFLIISLCHKRRKFLLFLLFASDMYPIRMFLYVTYFQFRCGGGGGGMQAIPNWHQSFLKETTLPPSDMRRKC